MEHLNEKLLVKGDVVNLSPKISYSFNALTH